MLAKQQGGHLSCYTECGDTSHFLKDLGRVPWGKALNRGRVTSENIITFVKYLFVFSSCCINL